MASSTHVQQLLDGPAAPPPYGLESNFLSANPHWNGHMIQFFVVIVFSLVSMTLRGYFQLFITKKVFAEDYILLTAFVLQIGVETMGFITVSDGMGKHMWNLTLRQYLQMTKTGYVFIIIYMPCIALVKTVVLLQFIRIFGSHDRTRIASWTWLVLNAMTFAAIQLIMVLECTPVDKTWTLAEGHCIDLKAVYQASGVFNAASDLIILIIPIPIILKLQVNARRKFLVLAVFAVGAIACGASVVRWYFAWLMFKVGDMSLQQYYTQMAMSVEIAAGIVVFCAPITPGVYRHLRSKVENMKSKAQDSSSMDPSELNVEEVKEEFSKVYD